MPFFVTIIFFGIRRKEYPPRSLLDLVDSQMYNRQDLLQRVSSISLFKAPAYWNVASGGLGRLGISTNDGETTTCLSNDSTFVRAKLASGVPILMATASDSAMINAPTWGSRRYNQPKKRQKISKLKKLLRSIMGKPKVKSS